MSGFNDERIQEAVYSMCNEEERSMMEQVCGKHLANVSLRGCK